MINLTEITMHLNVECFSGRKMTDRRRTFTSITTKYKKVYILNETNAFISSVIFSGGGHTPYQIPTQM